MILSAGLHLENASSTLCGVYRHFKVNAFVKQMRFIQSAASSAGILAYVLVATGLPVILHLQADHCPAPTACAGRVAAESAGDAQAMPISEMSVDG